MHFCYSIHHHLVFIDRLSGLPNYYSVYVFAVILFRFRSQHSHASFSTYFSIGQCRWRLCRHFDFEFCNADLISEGVREETQIWDWFKPGNELNLVCECETLPIFSTSETCYCRAYCRLALLCAIICLPVHWSRINATWEQSYAKRLKFLRVTDMYMYLLLPMKYQNRWALLLTFYNLQCTKFLT